MLYGCFKFYSVSDYYECSVFLASLHTVQVIVTGLLYQHALILFVQSFAFWLAARNDFVRSYLCQNVFQTVDGWSLSKAA